MRPFLFLTLAAYGVTFVFGEEDLTQYVNPFIGTTGGGNDFPGVSLPHGFTKVGLDALSSSSLTSGWSPNGAVTGISLMHESGTGGTPKYGVVSQMPIVGPLSKYNVANNRTYAATRSGQDVAEVGYYKFNLPGVSVELSATRHCGLLQYTRQSPEVDEFHVLVDVAHFLPALSGQTFLTETYEGGFIEVQDGGARYVGNGTYGGGWNRGDNWTIHFCAKFPSPPSSFGTFTYPYDPRFAQTVVPELKPDVLQGGGKTVAPGAIFTFDNITTTVTAKIGVSFMGVERACSYVDTELGQDMTFASTVAAAKAEWNKDVLSSITVPSTAAENPTQLQILYSSLYFSALLPSDRTGENPKWNSTEPYYDDFYTLWDTFGSWTPLWHLIQTKRYEGIVRALVDIWKFDGYMPDGRSSNSNGRTQGGSDADNVIADAFIKGFPNSEVNWDAAYQAILKDAEVTPENTNDPSASDSSTKEGRGALPDWIKLDFISVNFSRSVSRAVEYSLNDFAAAILSKGLGMAENTVKYLKRSKNWQNQWNDKLTFAGFDGFMGPKNADGTWFTGSYTIWPCGACYWGDKLYEGSPWEYSFSLPHDIAEIKKRMGGDQRFVERLDNTFDNGRADIGNEPSFLTPFLYNYVNGAQSQTVNQTRKIVNSRYNAGSSGIPGNSDAGSMQSWLLWNYMGLYPVVPSPVYLISSPFFTSLDVRLGTGSDPNNPAVLKIRAPKLSATNFYVQGVQVNGKTIDRSYILHDEIKNGATIEFDLGPTPAKWDTGKLPPSSSTSEDGFGFEGSEAEAR